MQSHEIWQKVENLENEHQIFREKCVATMATSMKFGDRNQHLKEELMVLMEESVAEKSKTLKILQLVRSESSSEPACFAEFRNIHGETAVILGMIEKVRKDVFTSDNTNVRSLHAHLLSLPFLPEPGRLRVPC